MNDKPSIVDRIIDDSGLNPLELLIAIKKRVAKDGLMLSYTIEKGDCRGVTYNCQLCGRRLYYE